MTLLQFQVLMQSLSAMAIAGGFIYAAVQFRNSRKAAYVANFTKLVELQLMLRRMRVDDPTLAHVYTHDVAYAADDREVRDYFFNLMQLSVFEIAWFSYRNGQVPRDYFESWDKRMREIAGEPSFRKMMGTPAMKILHDDFQAYVTDLVRNTPPLKSGR